jgi:hypothetical protein
MTGEAKRRQRAGTYPTGDNPIAAARRMFAGRSLGDVMDFAVPPGVLAVTLDVTGAPPVSLLVDPEKLTALMDQIGGAAGKLSYRRLVEQLARAFVQATAARADDDLVWIGLAICWTAMSHPAAGAAMRTAVSARLGTAGRAHIIWKFSPGGLAIAVADHFVSLDAAIAMARPDRVSVFQAPAAAGPSLN